MTPISNIASQLNQWLLMTIEWLYSNTKGILFWRQNKHSVTTLEWPSSQSIGSIDANETTKLLQAWLPYEKVVFTTLSLPRAARKNLKKTIALHVGHLSPWSLENSCWALADPTVSFGRLNVPIAITKKKYIDDILHAAPEYSRTCRISAKTLEGRQFTFYEKSQPLQWSFNPVWISAICIALTFYIVLLILNFRLETTLSKQKLVLTNNMGALEISEIRLSTLTSLLENSQGFLTTSLQLQLQRLENAIQALPDDFTIQDVTTSESGIYIKGESTNNKTSALNELTDFEVVTISYREDNQGITAQLRWKSSND